MKKIIFIIPLVFAIVIGTIIKPKAADIFGYPPDLANWYSEHLYSDYYHMTTGNISINIEREFITVYVPDFDNVITSAGQGTEQKIIFYDALDNVIDEQSVFGRLVGWFNYSIPAGTYSFQYYVLVQGPLVSNYVAEWNAASYIGYGDLLDIYQEAWAKGYEHGQEYGESLGYWSGHNDAYDVAYDDALEYIEINLRPNWEQQAKAQGYDDGLNDNVATGGFIMILSSAFIGVATVLGIELLPNITLGMIVAVPLVFGILFFILGKRKD